VRDSLCEMSYHHGSRAGFVSLYTQAFGVDFDCEAESQAWTVRFPSFDAFFSAALRAGSRPFPEDRAQVASPADGILQAPEPSTSMAGFDVKASNIESPIYCGDADSSATKGGSLR